MTNWQGRAIIELVGEVISMTGLENETLEDIIRESGLKLEKIAAEMDISVNYLWKLRQNPKKMDSIYLEKMAVALGVSIDRVFNAIKNFKE